MGRQCLFSWRELVRTVHAWRQKLKVMAAASVTEEGSEDKTEEQLQTTSNFPVRTAFIAPSALKSSSRQRSKTPSKLGVNFAEKEASLAIFSPSPRADSDAAT